MLLSQNSKLKKDEIFNFTLPAYKSSTGMITCPSAKDCIVNCYARQGCYTFSNVRAKHEANLAASLRDDFSETMIAEIIERKCSIVRPMDSGDYYSREYWNKWRKIAESLPHVKFYSYTKQIAMFKEEERLGNIPSNFTIIYSYGGVDDAMIDETNDRHAKCFIGDMPKGYVNASDSDLNAIGETKRIFLKYHGTKNATKNSFIKG